MPYGGHALFVIQGAWTGTDMANEVWQVGVRLGPGGTVPGHISDPAGYLTAILPAVQTWFNGAVDFRNDATLKYLKLNNIGSDGRYVEQVSHTVTAAGSGGSTPTAPAFVTLAATLETGFTLGRAHRGRIYLPTTYALASSNSTSITAASATSLANKVKGLLTAISIVHAPDTTAFVPIIASKIDATIRPVTGVSVNYVLDVQRRRKNRAKAVRSATIAFP